MGARRYRKDVTEAIGYAKALGFTIIEEKVKRGARHVKMQHPNGGRITFPATPSAPSWYKNMQGDAKRVARGEGQGNGK